MKFFGNTGIKVFVENVLLSRKEQLKNKIIIDIPAGSGHSSNILNKLGVKVEPFDLFPDFFKVTGLECKQADLSKNLPVIDSYADYVLCQEGIEHLPKQLFMFREFNRILKKNGTLFLTTPNNSQLRSKISYLLSESEYFYKIMPPNEMESIWFTNDTAGNDMYFGHIFLTGIQKLRILARITGFKIKKVHHTRMNHTSLVLLLLFYPLILIVNLLAYVRAIYKHKRSKTGNFKKVFREIIKLNIDPLILIDNHLFVEFEKECELDEAQSILQSKYTDFNIET